MARRYTVYIMTNRPQGTLYIGVTGDPVQRIWQHRTHAAPGFTDRYNLERVVHLESFDTSQAAIGREKALKRWNRAWKIALIEAENPSWRDLWADLTGSASDGDREILGSSPRMTPPP